MTWIDAKDAPGWVKAIVGLIVTLVVGVILMLDYVRLPEENRKGLVQLRMETHQLRMDVGSVQRLQEDQTDKLNQLLCLQLAEKQGGRWEECLQSGAK